MNYEREAVLQNADGRMHKAVDVLKHELATVRTGRANPGLVEHIQSSIMAYRCP